MAQQVRLLVKPASGTLVQVQVPAGLFPIQLPSSASWERAYDGSSAWAVGGVLGSNLTQP